MRYANGIWCAGPRWLGTLQGRVRGLAVLLGINNTLTVSQNRVDKKCTDRYTSGDYVDRIACDEHLDKEIAVLQRVALGD
jgi:hypothetical protein